MPDMGGDEVAGLLQEDPGIEHIKLALLTATDTKEENCEGPAEISGHTVPARPVERDALPELVDRFIGD